MKPTRLDLELLATRAAAQELGDLSDVIGWLLDRLAEHESHMAHCPWPVFSPEDWERSESEEAAEAGAAR